MEARATWLSGFPLMSLNQLRRVWESCLPACPPPSLRPIQTLADAHEALNDHARQLDEVFGPNPDATREGFQGLLIESPDAGTANQPTAATETRQEPICDRISRLRGYLAQLWNGFEMAGVPDSPTQWRRRATEARKLWREEFQDLTEPLAPPLPTPPVWDEAEALSYRDELLRELNEIQHTSFRRVR